MDIPLQCDTCGGKLGFQENHMICLDCSSDYDVDEFGVIHFKNDSYEYAHTDESTLELADQIRNMGTEMFFDDETIVDLEERYEEFGAEYCLDLSRFSWLDLTDLENQTVLDLGCGFGGASILSAKREADTVIAIDGNLGRLRFLAAWAEKEGIESIVPIHADALTLSFKSGSLDRCIMSGSLEWMGAMDNTNLSPPEVQRKVLRIIRNGISERGSVLIAIENRFAIQHFGGYTPHVVEPPFTTILPRRLAELISQRATGKPYEVYTHSYSGYEKLLTDSGFNETEFYYPIPDYQQPTAIISTTDNEVLSQALSQWNLSFPKNTVRTMLTLLGFLGVAHWFMPCYILRCEP